MIAIVVSRADEASEAIGERLLSNASWTAREDETRPDAEGGGTVHRHGEFELRSFEELHIHLDDPAAAFDEPPRFLVVVSRHSGETGPLLTAHFTGNFGPAEYGGEAGAFAPACPNAAKAVVDALVERAPDGYEVGIECTHHGPTAVSAPSMFVELGSDEPQWNDEAAADAVARAVLSLSGVDLHGGRQVVGFGGGHYAPRFGRIVRETDWAVGHVGADWCLDAMGAPAENRGVLERAFAASNAEYAVVDGEREELAATVESLGHRVVSETWLRETDGVPLGFVESVEAATTTVEDGLRFGEAAGRREGGAAEHGTETTERGKETAERGGRRADDENADWRVVALPTGLIEEARGVDGEATYDAAVASFLAFETDEGGTVPRGEAVVVSDADYDGFVEELVSVLARKYETVERDDGEVYARTSGFDPEKARTLGVPEGPAFGRLATGEPVEVDGETIHPETVESERERRFPL